MNARYLILTPLLTLMGPVSLPHLAHGSEPNRFYAQQMIELAVAHDENGVTTMQRMLEQNPRPAPLDAAAAQTALRSGQSALQADELDAALNAFQQASRSDPGNVEAVNYLGLVYRKLDRLPEAENALLQALALEPSRAVAWFQLAQIYALMNDARRALGALANTYRFAQNPMRAEEILRNIAENEAADTLRTAALETLRLYQLPVEAAIVPPLAPNPGIVPINTLPSDPP
jgi:tetratricopeptide (TPR) repeat protein